jgi:2-amino-4-hydroxy-6-hydroxymethyldihydropteridine diphosphokinase
MAEAGVLAYIGLGANLGDARRALADALAELARWPGSQALRASPLYRSAPVDAGGPDYLNAVAELLTTLEPDALLGALQAIEASHGRQRPYHHAPRTLDLDLLTYGKLCIASTTLTVPHPRLHERAFVLRPLADLAPELHIPGRGRVSDLLVAVQAQRVDRLMP